MLVFLVSISKSVLSERFFTWQTLHAKMTEQIQHRPEPPNSEIPGFQFLERFFLSPEAPNRGVQRCLCLFLPR